MSRAASSAKTAADGVREFTRLEFEQATPRLLEKRFCSGRWLLDCFEAGWRDPDGLVYRFLPWVYPPGGRDTRMIRCPSCQRLGPPPIIVGERCLDCQDVDFVAKSEAYQNDPQVAQMQDELSARWW